MNIDLNADLGELPAQLQTDLALLEIVTSANIACGGHAGDESSMGVMCKACVARNVNIGAHPSYPDRADFGRQSMTMTADALRASVRMQITTLARLAAASGGRVSHVKPHGALYHDAMRKPEIAQAIADAVRDAATDASTHELPALVALAGAPVLRDWQAQGFRTLGEAFADRTYEADGSLRSRSLPDALITTPELAAAQAVRLAEGALVHRPDTLCLHSDTPSALAIAKAVRAALTAAGFQVGAPH